jgi:Asp-tRNA(Asn)/Glu-tRNA(Gln) amidotransferase A subunit family amidase
MNMNAHLPHNAARVSPHVASPGCPSACEIRSLLLQDRLNPTQATEDCIARIQAHEGIVRAWQSFDPAGARMQARHAARDGLLSGIPIALKDLIDTRDWPTSYGSPIYAHHTPAHDAWVVRALRGQGAITMGKTVTTEFGYFQPGPTANPWNPAHTPGGSSSGSAAAVAAGMVPLALGTQTAGSLIRPASYCGVWALKATFGRYPLDGIKGLSHSLDTLGWMARSADDLELLRAALDHDDYTPLPTSNPHLLFSATHLASLLDAGGQSAWADGLQHLGRADIALEDAALPTLLTDLFDAQKTIMAWEAVRNLAPELTQHRERLGAALLQLLEHGQTVSRQAYETAQALARQGRSWLSERMQHADALLVPAAPGQAPAGLSATGDPAFSRVWNLLGNPCVNVPGLHGPNGLPIGMQLVGHPNRERALLSAAKRVGEILAAR